MFFFPLVLLRRVVRLVAAPHSPVRLGKKK